MARHLASAPEYQRCGRLVLYAALPDELPLWHAFAAVRAAGKTVLWPRVLPDGRAQFARADRVEELRAGRYGVLEPPPTVEAETLGPDVLVLVPGVAFDERGGRLGRGGGIWDRALADARGAAVFGVGYELQIVERIPREPHDCLLDALLTEFGIRRFGTS